MGQRLTELRQRLLTMLWQADQPLGAYDMLPLLTSDGGQKLAAATMGSASAYRSRKAATGGFCTSTATLLFGFAVFGCPGCIMPLFGTLGVTLFANVLPLFGLEFKVASIAITLAAIVSVFRQPRAAVAEMAGRHPSLVP